MAQGVKRNLNYSNVDWTEKKIFYQGKSQHELNFEELFETSKRIINVLVSNVYYNYHSYYDDFIQECAIKCMYIYAYGFKFYKGGIYSLLKTSYDNAILNYIKYKLHRYEKNVFCSTDDVIYSENDMNKNEMSYADILMTQDKYAYDYELINEKIFTADELFIYRKLCDGFKDNEIFTKDDDLKRIEIISSIKTKLCNQLGKDPRSKSFLKEHKNYNSIKNYYLCLEKDKIKDRDRTNHFEYNQIRRLKDMERRKQAKVLKQQQNNIEMEV